MKVKESVKQSFSYYPGDDGSVVDSYGEDGNPRFQASGAYIFRPNGTYPIKSEGQVSLTVLRGPLLDEVHQRINSWIYQVTRVYKEKEHAEIEFTIGPIPVDDGIGKEIVTKITTSMRTNKQFYTDSNGRDFIQRIRDYTKDWNLEVNQPVAGNYHPINLGIYMKDNNTELSVLVDRSVGGSSIVDGQLELMLHRRLLADDDKGIAEQLDEKVCIEEDCKGLTIEEDKDLSVMASVELKKVFANKKIKHITEMSLTANQEIREMERKRLVWNVEGSNKEPKALRGGAVDPTKLVVDLAPMEIRTFIVNF